MLSVDGLEETSGILREQSLLVPPFGTIRQDIEAKEEGRKKDI